MANQWFYADPHFDHKNILVYEKRPFQNIEHMNKSLVKNFNEKVTDDDICYNLGDVAFGKRGSYFINQLNGRHVVILGNHDKNRGNKIPDKIFSAVLHIGGLNVFCVHDPMNSNPIFELNLCGHCHSWFREMELHEKGKRSLIINVGVDVWDYKPVSWEQIYTIYMRWKKGIIKPEIFDKKELQRIRHERKRK